MRRPWIPAFAENDNGWRNLIASRSKSGSSSSPQFHRAANLPRTSTSNEKHDYHDDHQNAQSAAIVVKRRAEIESAAAEKEHQDY